LRRVFGSFKGVNITAARIKAYTIKRLGCPKCGHLTSTHAADHSFEGAAPATVNKELANLHRMFVLGRKVGLVSFVPPIDKLHEDNVRKGFVEQWGLTAILDKLPHYLKGVIEVAYLTAWRKSELLSREWKHVDFTNGWLKLEPGETKNGKGRQCPLFPQLLAVLNRQRAYTVAVQQRTGRIVPWIFHNEGNQVKDYDRAWKSACKSVGLAGQHVHDLRRSGVRNLTRSGVTERVAMQISGHTTRAIFDRYDIVSESDLKAAGDKLQTLHNGAPVEAAKVVSIART
jgi:integrase